MSTPGETPFPPKLLLSIVMPAFNEAATIRAAVDEVLSVSYPCPIELIVVDDGSTDGTADVLAAVDDPRLRVFSHPTNRGKGAALQTAIAHARGSYLCPFDADLEYRAQDILTVLAPVMSGSAAVVYGSRLFGWNTVYQSFRYKLGNRATTLAANVLFDSALSDLHTCLKLMPLPTLRAMALTETRFGLDTEITAKVLRSGHRPFEVPVHYYSRTHAQGKKINWRDGVRCLVVLARVRLSAVPQLPDYPRRNTASVPVLSSDALAGQPATMSTSSWWAHQPDEADTRVIDIRRIGRTPYVDDDLAEADDDLLEAVD